MLATPPMQQLAVLRVSLRCQRTLTDRAYFSNSLHRIYSENRLTSQPSTFPASVLGY